MDLAFVGLSPRLAELSCGAMYAVAAADGDVAKSERELLAVAASLLGVDKNQLRGASADDIATQLPDPVDRVAILRAMILMALMDGRIDPDECAVIEHYAAVLGVDDARVRNLRQITKGHYRLLFVDLARRSFARDIFVRELRDKGPVGIWKIVGPMIGRANDAKLAAAYRAYGELAEGTLGRAYWQFIQSNDLAFPGEPYAVPETGVWHDMTHVLAGYDTCIGDEVLVVSFIAGYTRSDPFFWLFTIALQFHLGIDVSPYSPVATGLFDAKKVLAAVDRGSKVVTDLSQWDWRPHVARPLEEVRRDLGIGPRADRQS